MKIRRPVLRNKKRKSLYLDEQAMSSNLGRFLRKRETRACNARKFGELRFELYLYDEAK